MTLKMKCEWKLGDLEFDIDVPNCPNCRMRVSEDYKQQLNIGSMENLLQHFRSFLIGGGDANNKF